MYVDRELVYAPDSADLLNMVGQCMCMYMGSRGCKHLRLSSRYGGMIMMQQVQGSTTLIAC
jgi:hypothetical protein